MPEPKEDEEARLVDFPVEKARIPPTRLPETIGRIAPGHPLTSPMIIALIALGIILAIHIIVSFTTKPSAQDTNSQTTFSESSREPGSITYDGDRLRGWFLDEERQHFLAEDGSRFTYVDAHSRGGSPVAGHWRLIE